MTAPGAARRVIRLDLEARRLPEWTPGDAVGVVCRNHPGLVEWLCGRLGLDGGAYVRFAPAVVAAGGADAELLGGSGTPV